jgi:hypothetical protein
MRSTNATALYRFKNGGPWRVNSWDGASSRENALTHSTHRLTVRAIRPWQDDQHGAVKYPSGTHREGVQSKSEARHRTSDGITFSYNTIWYNLPQVKVGAGNDLQLSDMPDWCTVYLLHAVWRSCILVSPCFSSFEMKHVWQMKVISNTCCNMRQVVCVCMYNMRKRKAVTPAVRLGSVLRTHARTHTLFSLSDKKRSLARPSCRCKIININGFQRSRMGAWTSFIWLRTETDGGCCECGNEPSGSIQRGEFLD